TSSLGNSAVSREASLLLIQSGCCNLILAEGGSESLASTVNGKDMVSCRDFANPPESCATSRFNTRFIHVLVTCGAVSRLLSHQSRRVSSKSDEVASSDMALSGSYIAIRRSIWPI